MVHACASNVCTSFVKRKFCLRALPWQRVNATTAASVSERWRDLLDSHARVSGALEKALQVEHGLGVSEFEVLDRLANGDKDQRRMQELADSVHLSQSALSRAVQRLEDAGYVSREICSTDRRGIFARITDEGTAAYDAARPTHRRVLSEVLN